MRHIKIFEAWDEEEISMSAPSAPPKRNPFGRDEMEQIKQLPAYRDLLARGFIDVSTPQGLRQGNIRFAPAVPDLNSTIRINLNGSVWHDLSSGRTIRLDRLDPITTIEGYGDRISMIPDFIHG
jgi:hypothetical protein